MSNLSDEEMRNSIIGLGEKSVRKSYYPQLKTKIKEIEELNKNLEKKVEERTRELQEQKEIFETLFNETSDAIALIKDNHFVDCNNAVLKLLKYESKDSFLHTQPHEISPTFQPDGKSSDFKSKQMIRICLEKGQNRFEWVHKRSNNEEFWVDTSLTKIVLDHQDYIHVVWRDITDKKLLEEEIQKRNDELEDFNNELQATIGNLKLTQKKLVESEKMASLGEIVSNVSKEINKPVDIAVTTLTYLMHTIDESKELFENKNIKDEELQYFFDTAQSSSNIINNSLISIAKLIRYFQQIKVAKEENKSRTFNVTEYIHGILLNVRHKYPKYDFHVDIFCEDNLEVHTSAEDFQTIISIMLINSIKHAFNKEQKGYSSIDILIRNHTLFLTYKDKGNGIKKEIIPKIFEPFFTTSKDENDHGLGLSIVYNIITNKFNGTISCHSEENIGTTFNISIPLKQYSDEKDITYHL